MEGSLTFALEDSKMGKNGTVIKYPQLETHCLVSIIVISQYAQYYSSEVNSSTIQNTMSAE